MSDESKAKPVIGLVGGIGSGKSQCRRRSPQRGGGVVAGDPLGHVALRQPAIREQVVDRWGKGVLESNGEIDRRALGALVFADPDERRSAGSDRPAVDRRAAADRDRRSDRPTRRCGSSCWMRR